MPLKENELFGNRDKVSIAIMRIKEFEPIALQNNPAGYYVCISGGKDSTVIQELCLMAGVKCEFVHNHTSVDHPETVYFVRCEKERMEKMGYTFRIECPRDSAGKQKTMWEGIRKNGLPTRLFRWCCRELKEYGGKGRYCITGVRWAESAKRKKRGIHEMITKNKDDRIVLNNDNDMRRRFSEFCIPEQKYMLNPIIDWTEEDVWEFIHKRKIPYNSLYDVGFKRVGCIGCPMSKKSRARDFEENPKYEELYFKAVLKHFEYRKERGLKMTGIMETPNRYFEWWLKC
jgi:3'-phosphoadenosine 5'-phosphosulfate sulfotransferase (PAPS reductase)/FAD synthetase